jgi:redox-sensitive bicupin YhaK (pirin superfamily)
MEPGTTIEQQLEDGFGAYLFLIEGEIDLDGRPLTTGDAAMIRDEKRLTMSARQPSELIMVRVEV